MNPKLHLYLCAPEHEDPFLLSWTATKVYSRDNKIPNRSPGKQNEGEKIGYYRRPLLVDRSAGVSHDGKFQLDLVSKHKICLIQLDVGSQVK